MALQAGVMLHELSPRTESLEDAFLRRRPTAQEYRSGAGDPVMRCVIARHPVTEWIKLPHDPRRQDPR